MLGVDECVDETLFSEVELRRRSEPLTGAIVEAGCFTGATAAAAAVDVGGDAVEGAVLTGGVAGTICTLPSASTTACPCTAARTACVSPTFIPQMALRNALERRSRTVGTENRLPAGDAGMLGLDGPRDEGPREIRDGRRSACGASSGEGFPPAIPPLLLSSVLLICSGDCGGGSVIGEWLLLLELDRLDPETGLGDVWCEADAVEENELE